MENKQIILLRVTNNEEEWRDGEHGIILGRQVMGGGTTYCHPYGDSLKVKGMLLIIMTG